MPHCWHFILRKHNKTRNDNQRMQPDVAYCIAGKVNSADKLYLVIESVRLDTKHARCSMAPSLADGAGGSATS